MTKCTFMFSHSPNQLYQNYSMKLIDLKINFISEIVEIIDFPIVICIDPEKVEAHISSYLYRTPPPVFYIIDNVSIAEKSLQICKNLFNNLS